MTSLERQILDCFPSGEYAITALLRLVSIEESSQVPTAAVAAGSRPRLLVNPDFRARHAATPEQLFLLVMHELHHVLLGHTRLFPDATAVDNFVFDCVINAMLSRRFPRAEQLTLLTEYYSEREFPACLLRPRLRNGRLRTDCKPHSAALAGLTGRRRDRVADVYRGLYSSDGVSYEELRDILPAALDERAVRQVPLLGGHGAEQGAAAGDKPAHCDETLVEAVCRAAERWPALPDPALGRSLAGLLQERRTARRPVKGNRAVLRGLLARVGGRDAAGRVRCIGEDSVAAMAAVPIAADRTALVQRAHGAQPLLYRYAQNSRRRIRAGDQVHVYADVSGSMHGIIGAMYAAILDCRRWVHPNVHLFSTEVHDVTLQELRAGDVRTTYGTDIVCVAEHMAARGVRRACVITDGYVGAPADAHRETLARAKLGVAWTGACPWRQDLEEIADWTATLRDGEDEQP